MMAMVGYVVMARLEYQGYDVYDGEIVVSEMLSRICYEAAIERTETAYKKDR